MLDSAGLIDLETRLGAANYQPLDVVLSEGKGVWVTDLDGNRYLDCLAAYSAVNQGHCHPEIMRAMVEQAGRLTLMSRAFRNDQLGDFFGEIAALTGSPRTADVVTDEDTTLLEVPADALRATMTVPEIQRLVFSTLTSRLMRTEAADLPRLAGPDQEALRDLRTPRPSVEALPRSYTGEAAS